MEIDTEQNVACEDLVRLPLLFTEAVLQCLVDRYEAGHFYTWAGVTLVAVNPCHHVDLYHYNNIKFHKQQIECGEESRDAHIYSLAGIAYYSLTHGLGCTNQAILVSGDSGAGKTQSARHLLSYLTVVDATLIPVINNPTVATAEALQNRILASNPILEAFGNAATLRNHNSSRFGKLVRVQYGGQRIRGAQIDTYLLEKTRVAHQMPGESNFHVFYQTLAGAKSGGHFDSLGLNWMAGHRIVADCAVKVDVETNLQETLQAFRQLEFTEEHQMEIFKVVASLIHLGDIRFYSKEKEQDIWTVDTRDAECRASLRSACRLLGVSENKLATVLTVSTISVNTLRRMSVFHKPCESESQCSSRRDALMQNVYNSLFQHIVAFINSQINADRKMWSQFLGLLDVYGFESFEFNSLEQLCINYANERLQQQFLRCFLTMELQVLKEEGLIDVDIPFLDNSACVDALDSKISVFGILNEQCQLKRAISEEDACHHVCKALQATGVICPPTSFRNHRRGLGGGFVVHHYAGLVKYDAEGLLRKNKDQVPSELTDLIVGSSVVFISTLARNGSQVAFGTPLSKGVAPRQVTTLGKFKTSLDTLMKLLTSCDLHYVRCLKPNAMCSPDNADREYLLRQMCACGIVETVKISQAGYPVRIGYVDFCHRYSNFACQDLAEAKEETARIMTNVLDNKLINVNDISKYRFGKSKLFLTKSLLLLLENLVEKKRICAAVCIQKYVRRFLCVKSFYNIKAAILTIQTKVRIWLLTKKEIKKNHGLRMNNAARLIQQRFRAWRSRRYQDVQKRYLHGSKHGVDSGFNLNTPYGLLASGINTCVTVSATRDAEESGIETDNDSDSSEFKSDKNKTPTSLHSSDFLDQSDNSDILHEKDHVNCNTGEPVRYSCTIGTSKPRNVGLIVSLLNLKLNRDAVTNFPEMVTIYVESRGDISLFFCDGIISYRRRPLVAIRFHTKKTCLPSSFRIPHQELSRGLYDAFL